MEKKNGFLRITPIDDGSFMVFYLRPVAGGSTLPRTFHSTAQLRTFLVNQMKIDEQRVAEALEAVCPQDPQAKAKSHTIPEVWLTDDEAQHYGLR